MAILNKEGINRIILKKAYDDQNAEKKFAEDVWGMLSKIRECKEDIIDFLDTKNELYRIDMSEAFDNWFKSSDLKLRLYTKSMYISIAKDSILFYWYGGEIRSTTREVGIRYNPMKDEFEFSLKYTALSCSYTDIKCKTFIIKDLSDIHRKDFKERYTVFEYPELLDIVSNGLKSFLDDFQKWISSIDENVNDNIGDEEKPKPHLNFFTIIIQNWLKL